MGSEVWLTLWSTEHKTYNSAQTAGLQARCNALSLLPVLYDGAPIIR